MKPFLSKINPNESVGGGGCLSHPIKSVDTVGPFVVFPATETDSMLSPHAVLCALCYAEAKALMEGDPREALAGGEDDSVTAIEDIAI